MIQQILQVDLEPYKGDGYYQVVASTELYDGNKDDILENSRYEIIE